MHRLKLTITRSNDKPTTEEAQSTADEPPQCHQPPTKGVDPPENSRPPCEAAQNASGDSEILLHPQSPGGIVSTEGDDTPHSAQPACGITQEVCDNAQEHHSVSRVTTTTPDKIPQCNLSAKEIPSTTQKENPRGQQSRSGAVPTTAKINTQAHQPKSGLASTAADVTTQSHQSSSVPYKMPQTQQPAERTTSAAGEDTADGCLKASSMYQRHKIIMHRNFHQTLNQLPFKVMIISWVTNHSQLQ